MVTFILLFLYFGVINVNADQDNVELIPKLPHTVKYTNNEFCKEDNALYEENLKNRTLWAYNILDSNAKEAFGILHGNIYQLGNWEGCLNVNGPFETQYCLVALNLSVPNQDSTKPSVFNVLKEPKFKLGPSKLKPFVALCVPASCPAEDVEKSMNKYFTEGSNNNIAKYSATVNDCQSKSKTKKFDELDVAFCLLTLLIVFLVMVSTFLDLTSGKTTKRVELTLAFSLKNGWSKLLSDVEYPEETNIFSGIRTIGMLLIVVNHKLEAYGYAPLINFDTVQQVFLSKAYYVLSQADLLVDTFFLIGGLLLSYNLLQLFKTTHNVNPLLMLVSRYVRLTPLYAYVIFYMSSVFYHSGSGPLWNSIIRPQMENCQNNWWTNILYISNYVNVEKPCFHLAWYLSCDFHFFIVGLIIMVAIKKRKIVGYGLLAIFLCLSIIAPFVLTIIYKTPPVFDLEVGTLSVKYLYYIYSTSHTRAGSYLIGIIGGIIYNKVKNESKRMSKCLSNIIFFSSIFCMILSAGALSMFYDGYENTSLIKSAIYVALHRIGWSIGSVGVLLTASFGYSKITKSILSWWFWIPLGKLTYAAFLIHVPLQHVFIARTASPIYYTYYDGLSAAISDLVIVFMVSFLLYACIEKPFREIFKIITTKDLKIPQFTVPGDNLDNETNAL